MVSLKHKFTSAKANGGDATLIRPSNWNDEHDLTLGASRLLGRDQSAPGAVQELVVVPHGLGDTFEFWTGDKIRDAINDAINAIPTVTWVPTGATLGWYSNTLPAGGWLFLNGRTFGNAGSGASISGTQYQNLFTFLWTNLTNAVCPVQTSAGAPSTRGATAAADWAALKRMVLPDECGRVSAPANNMGGVASKNRLTPSAGGIDGDVLGAWGGLQNSVHSHTGQTGVNAPPGGYGSVGSGPATGDHGHPFTTDGTQMPIVQPTIIKNVIIKL